MKLSHDQWKALRRLAAQPSTLRELRAAGCEIKQGQLSEMCNGRKMGGLALVTRTRKRRAADPSPALWDIGAKAKTGSVYAVTEKGAEVARAHH